MLVLACARAKVRDRVMFMVRAGAKPRSSVSVRLWLALRLG